MAIYSKLKNSSEFLCFGYLLVISKNILPKINVFLYINDRKISKFIFVKELRINNDLF